MPAIGIESRVNGAPPSVYSVVKRGNWADRNRGVVLVFCIVFLVVVGVIALFAYRRMLKRKADKESYETTSD
ncbi:hypothetical protein N7452_006271 [Penicillium brevicompactum]|uniref:Uncharacterized protein n=1 Tax=Penicillium brevicompactum TaxID=5074 RepID=A0A9W9UFU7_PENBR|nr:hypothetical protein N7452_006271 [Penicillium brevicompactum]